MIRSRPALTVAASLLAAALLPSAGCAGRLAAARVAHRIADNAKTSTPAHHPNLMSAHNAFYTALNEMCAGSSDGMVNVWSQSPDATDFGPDGQMHVGWPAVEAQFRKEAAMKLGGTVSCQDLKVVQGDDFGITTCVEVGTGMKVDGKPAELRFRSTNVFRKEGDCWRLVHHHTDQSKPMEAKP